MSSILLRNSWRRLIKLLVKLMNIWQDSNNALSNSIPNSSTVDEMTNVVKWYENNKPVYYTQEELNKRKEMYVKVLSDITGGEFNERNNKRSS
jgi:hypothetical protein